MNVHLRRKKKLLKDLGAIKGSNYYSTPAGAVNSRIIAENSSRLSDELIRKYGRYRRGLIMGIGDGKLIEYFKDKFKELVIVEGSKPLTRATAEKYRNVPSIRCSHSYFEDFILPKTHCVDVVLGNHVLEHVDNPRRVLSRSKSWLGDKGIAIFSVPHARSLHRRIGVRLGMLKTIYDLNESDTLVGHQRVYDTTRLTRDVESAGYRVIQMGGFNLKLVSQKQMKNWPRKLIHAIFEVSRECPVDVCSNLFVVCKRG